MKPRRFIPGLLALSMLAAVALEAQAQPVREIPDRALPDIAMATMDVYGPVIVYNPDMCQAAGVACQFVRAHEYGHISLGHLTNAASMTTMAGRAAAEAEADCYAARTSSPWASEAMARLVESQLPDPRDAIYGSKSARAARIRACAGL